MIKLHSAKTLTVLALALLMLSSTAFAQENELLGTGAGGSLTTGTDNVFIGDYAGQSVTTGGGNTMVGKFAGRNMTTGYGNIIIGYIGGDALTATDSFKLAIGPQD